MSKFKFISYLLYNAVMLCFLLILFFPVEYHTYISDQSWVPKFMYYISMAVVGNAEKVEAEKFNYIVPNLLIFSMMYFCTSLMWFSDFKPVQSAITWLRRRMPN